MTANRNDLDPAQRLQTLDRALQQAKQALERRESLDLAGLDRETSEICATLTSLPSGVAKTHLQALEALLGTLDELAEELKASFAKS